MIALIAVHAVVSLLAPLLVRSLGRNGFWLCALPPAATAVWALTQTSRVTGGGQIVESHEWVPSLGMTLSFRMDPLAWLMCLVVGGVGALVLVYCSRYFDDDSPGVGRFAMLLTAFAGAMLALVTSDDMLVLYLAWELTTILSFLLIGHEAKSRASRAAAMQALIVTTVGGLAMLGGIVMLGEAAGTYRLSEVLAAAPGLLDQPVVGWAVALMLVGALSKSALLPFHFWLPGAMAAPTPVSAYLHAAAMVKAGIYLVARLAPGFASLPAWRVMVLVLGGGTMLLGAWRSLRQHDLKLLLAFGTVSQLGFLVVLTGAGTQQAALAGVTMLLAHALYKGALFLVVGVIDHSTGTRDLRRLSGLRSHLPWLFVAACVAAASMAGLPPLLGFVGKEAVYAAFTGSQHGWAWPVLVVLVLGSALTVAYSARFVWGGFRTQRIVEPTKVHAPGAVLVGVPLVLALAGLVAGLGSTVLEPRLAAYAASLPSDGEATHLGLWHGFTLPLLLSAITLTLGALLFAARSAVNRAQSGVGRLTGARGADDIYRALMHSLDRGSLRLTGALHRGSLPLSLGLILGTFVLLVGGTLLRSGAGPGQLRAFDNLGQLAAGIVVIVAAWLATRSRRRLRAVFLVGVSSYGVAVLFLLFGGPDLALTQVLAETLSLVVIVLVLRRLPSKFADDSRRSRRIRAAFAIACGAVVTWLALTIPQARMGGPASAGLSDTAVDYGGGANIVNVILVDVRAWDTMGELSVVIAAAAGISSLVFLSGENLPRVRGERVSVSSRRRIWLPRTDTLAASRRSLILEVIIRIISYPVLMWSVFLLFSGHSTPGGGFAAGLVAGLALAMRYLAGGQAEMHQAVRVAPGLLLGAGLFLSSGTGVISMLAGGDVLQSWIFDIPVPLIGKVHLVTSVFFDIGVYLVVIGLVLDVLRSLGVGIDRDDGVAIEDPVPYEPAGGQR